MNEQFSEEILEKIMLGVASAGNAKSLGKEAIFLANENKFEEARNLFKEAKKSLLEAHSFHFDFIQKEASGEKIELSLLLVHLEDHIMTTSSFLDSLEDQINLIERVSKLESLIQTLI